MSYASLVEAVDRARDSLDRESIGAGAIVALPAGFSARATALLFALAERGVIAVPLGESVPADAARIRCEIAAVEWVTVWTAEGEIGFERERCHTESHPLVAELRRRGRPGLVLFTSGTTGGPKAVLHDLAALLGRFKVQDGAERRVLPLMLADHVGGFDMLWRGLAGGITIVSTDDRSPEGIANAVQRHRVEVIATTPSQLNSLYSAGVLCSRTFATVRLVTHGAEPMPPALEARLRRTLPAAEFRSRFGTTETAAIRIRNRMPGSAEFCIEDPAVEWRIEDGELLLRTGSNALGYLNASGTDRFMAEGWYRTGDQVAVTEEKWLRFVGRRCDVINVGGEKVHPETVEAVLLENPDVEDCAVYPVANALLGQVVAVDVVWRHKAATALEVKRALGVFAAEKLERAERPVCVNLVGSISRTETGKKLRGRPPS